MTTAASSWPLWSTQARLVVTAPARLDEGKRLADRMLAEVDLACSRFRPDSELSRIQDRLPSGVEVSPLLAGMVRDALRAAEETDGAVDPTLGNALEAAGYDRDIALIEDSDAIVRAVVSRRPGWKNVRLSGTRLRVPGDLSLDLGATAKAAAADRIAATLSDALDCGVLLGLGGDIATAGDEPDEGWNVLVQDLPADPAARVRIGSGSGLATSSTQKRRWRRGEEYVHHILDPRTGLPAEPVWRTVTVHAESCLRANTRSTAAIVLGVRAPEWLGTQRVAARLVRRDGRVLTVGGWPPELTHELAEAAS